MKKVLVIEDNKNNMRLITKFLNKAGYETIEAETGEEGIRLALEKKPDLILIDIKLPGMDGLETTRKLKECNDIEAVPIIAVTSYAMVGDREQYLKEGFAGYIEKPLDPFTIIKEIEQIWKKSIQY